VGLFGLGEGGGGSSGTEEGARLPCLGDWAEQKEHVGAEKNFHSVWVEQGELIRTRKANVLNEKGLKRVSKKKPQRKHSNMRNKGETVSDKQTTGGNVSLPGGTYTGENIQSTYN